MSDLCGSGSKTPKEIRDKWRTPKAIFKAVDKHFHFVADVAASRENALCNVFIPEEQNTLITPWSEVAKPGEFVWLNPPYSDPAPFIHKAAKEHRENNIGSVILVPGDNSVGWFDDLYQTCQIIQLITKGRISFINAATGKKANGNNKGSLLAYYLPYQHNNPCIITAVRRNDLLANGEDHEG